MRKDQFRHVDHELPTDPGEYEARAYFGKYKVYFDGLKWYTLTGERIMVTDWRDTQ